jgi:hypothetical protein
LEKAAWLRLAPARFVTEHTMRFRRWQEAKTAPAKFAKLRLEPLRSAPDRSAPGQLVKFVAVGFETIVQPLMTMSADAGLAVAVANTGVRSAMPITRAVPVTRTRGPIIATPDLRCG